MKQKKVSKAIVSEREHQERQAADEERTDMIAPFNMGQGVLAIDHLLTVAKMVWYNDSPPYTATMEYLRKIAGVCVNMGEQYGMPFRPDETAERGMD